MSDEDLTRLERWRGGDAAAGNVLFQRYFESLYRFFDRKTEGDVDDLVQETMVACLRGIEGFRYRSSFRTYLYAIARHVLFGYWRRRASDRRFSDFDEVSLASLSTTARTRIAEQEEKAALLEALQSLPLEQQVLLEMYYWRDLNRHELAEVYDVEQATIGTRLLRARRALQEKMQQADASERGNDDFDAWARSLRG